MDTMSQTNRKLITPMRVKSDKLSSGPGRLSADRKAEGRQSERVEPVEDWFGSDINAISSAFDKVEKQRKDEVRAEKESRSMERKLFRGENAKVNAWIDDLLRDSRERVRETKREDLMWKRVELAKKLDKKWSLVRKQYELQGLRPLLHPAYGRLVAIAKKAPLEFERLVHATLVTEVSRKYRPPEKTRRTVADILQGSFGSPLPTPQGFSVGNLDDLELFFDRFGRPGYGRDHDPRPYGRAIIVNWLSSGDHKTAQKLFWEYADKRFARLPRGTPFVPQGLAIVDNPRMLQFELQGPAQSRPPGIDLDLHTAFGPSTIRVVPPTVPEILASYVHPSLLDKTKYQMLGSLIAFTYAMSAAPSCQMFFTQFGAFLGNHVEHFPRFHSEFMSLFRTQGAGLVLPARVEGDHDAQAVAAVVMPMINAEPGEWERARNFMSMNYDKAMSSSLTRSMFDLVGLVSISTLAATSGFFGSPAAALHFLSEIKKHLRKDVTVDTFAGNCFRILQEFGNRVVQCVKDGSIEPLFDSKRTPEQLRLYISTLLYNEEIIVGSSQMLAAFESQRAQNAYPREIFAQMTVFERDNRLRELKDEVVFTYKLFCSTDKLKAQAGEWGRILGDVEKTIAKRTGQEAASKQRVQPFGLLIWGPKGTGKTTMVNRMIDVVARAENLPTGGQAVGNMQIGVNFQDTLYSHTWAVKVDDPGMIRVKPQAGTMPVCQMLCAMINRECYEYEKSDVSKKGTAFCSARFVPITNNEPGLNADIEITTPDALWRRLKIRICQKARPEVCDGGGESVNPELAAMFENPDVNIFYVETYKDGARSLLDGKPYAAVQGLYPTFDSRAVILFVLSVYRQHMMRENHHLANVTAGNMCDRCLQYHVGLCYGQVPEPENVAPEPEEEKEDLPDQQEEEKEDMPYYQLEDEEEDPLPETFEIDESVECDVCGYIHEGPCEGAPFNIVVRPGFDMEEPELQVRGDFLLAGGLVTLTGAMATPIAFIATRGGFLTKALNRFDHTSESLFEAQLLDVLVSVGSSAIMLGGVALIIHGLVASEYEIQAGQDPDKAVAFAHSARSDFSRFTREDIPLTSSSKARCLTLDALEKIVFKSIVKIATLNPNRSMYGLFITGNTLVYPRHLLCDTDDPSFSRIAQPTARRLLITPLDSHTIWHVDLDFSTTGNSWPVPDRDLIMTAVCRPNWKGSDLTPYLLSADASKISFFDEVRFLRPEGTLTAVQPKMGFGQTLACHTKGINSYYPFPTVSGECGIPTCASYAATVFIASIHAGGGSSAGDRIGYGEFLPAAAIAAGLGRLASHDFSRQFKASVPACFLNVQSIDISRPEKSSAYLAASRAQGPVFVEGTISEQINGSTLKTKVEQLPVVGATATMAEYMGYTPLDFGPPPFKGNMEASEWHDAYTRFFQEVPACVVDREVMEEAFQLYECGMENLVGIGQVRVLSVYEAVRGISGTGIRSVNRATSSGAPAFTKKKNLIDFEDETQSVYLEPKLVSQIDEVERLLEAGEIPVPLATLGLKDEVLDASKISRRKVRLFTILPLAFQISLKRRLRPLCDLFRCNRDFFESYVGFNAADIDEVSAFIQRLKYGKRLDDADFAFYDVRQSAEFAVRQALFWRNLAECAGYSQRQCQDVYLLCLALCFILRLVKRELVSIVGANPSGSDITTEWNSVINSTLIRYGVCSVKKRKLIIPGPMRDWFRTLFILATFGDDGASSSSCDWCTYEEIADALIPIGAILTPGTKEGSFRPLQIEEITFLKRKPVFHNSIGEWTMALSKKSIAKMIFWRLKGALSVLDHMSVVMSGALREAFLHGSEFFEPFRLICLEMAGQLGILSNSNLSLPTFDYLKDAYIKRTHISWGVPEEVFDLQSWDTHGDFGVSVRAELPPTTRWVPLGPPLLGTTMQGSSSFDPPWTVWSLRPLPPPPMSELTKELMGSHASPVPVIGQIAGVEPELEETDDVAVSTDLCLLGSMNYVENDLLYRPFRLTTGVFLGTNVRGDGQVIDNILTLWRNSNAAGNVLRTHSGYRADFDVWVTFSAAATTGGYAVLSAVPFCGTDPAAIGVRRWQEDLGFPHSITFFSTKPEGKLSLPFIYNKGFVDDLDITLWQVRFFVHSPLVADGNATPRVDYAIWAQAKNARLFNPTLQSGGEVKWSQVAAKLATLPLPMGMSTGLSAASMALGAMGHTRSNDEQHIQGVVRRAVSNSSRVDGPDSSDIVSFLPGAGVSTDPGSIPGSQESDLDFATLCSRHTHIGTLGLTSADVDTSIKAWIPVTPFVALYTASPFTEFSTTPAAVAMFPFAAWRGSMEYTFVSSFSALQRATIQVFWVPQWQNDVAPTAANLSLEGTNVYYNTTFELRPGQCYNFRVGWRSNNAVEGSTFALPKFNSSVDLATCTTGAQINGCVIVRVVNAVVGAETTTASVEVYARGLQDMRPAPYMRQNVYIFDGAVRTTTALNNFRLQVGIFDLDCNEFAFEVPPVNEVSTQITASETIDSVRAILQRPSLAFQTPNSVGGITITYNMCQSSNLVSMTGVTPTFTNFTLPRWYTAMFAGVRGSMRVKIFTHLAGNCRAFTDIYAEGTDTNLGMVAYCTGACVQFLKPSEHALEMAFPYKSPTLFAFTRLGSPTTAVTVIQGDGPIGGLAGMMSYGPDVSVVGYIGGCTMTSL